MLQRSPLDKLDSFFYQYKPLQYKARVIISHPHDTQSSVFYIKSGFLRVFRISEQGEELTLTILKPHDFFPLTYGMTNDTNTNAYYLETITPLTIWKVRVDQFLAFVHSEPDVYFALTEKLLIRFDSVVAKIEYLVFSNAYTKVAATLISCGKKFGERHGTSVILTVPLTHKDIATLVGVTRETTSLEMKKLERQGYISRSGRYLIIKNIEKLESEIFTQTGTKSSFYQTL